MIYTLITITIIFIIVVFRLVKLLDKKQKELDIQNATIISNRVINLEHSNSQAAFIKDLKEKIKSLQAEVKKYKPVRWKKWKFVKRTK